MKQALTIMLLLFVLNSCTTLEEPESPEVVQPTPSDNIYDEFNRWMYYQMNEQYFWRADLPDSLECDYNLPPKDFFKSLLSDKDRFSYFTSNPNFKNSRSIGVSNNLGFEYQLIEDALGNQWMYVLYIYDKHAKSMGIRRGNLLKQISCGIYKKANIVNGKIHGLEPDVINLAFNVVNDRNSVLLDSIYNVADKQIGYLCYLEFSEIEDLIAPLTRFATSGINELVLDLRYNPGGYVNTCKFLCNCIISPMYYGKVFQICSYNSRLSQKYFNSTGDECTYSYFKGPPQIGEEILGEYTVIPLNLDRITIITSSHTASASEATVICLNPYMDITIIGEQTVGKGVGSWLISDPKYKYAIQPITMRYYNSLKETTPDEGLIPDIYVKDGYSVNVKDIGDIDEHLLNIALSSILPKTSVAQSRRNQIISDEIPLTPIGDPSYVTEFNNKQYNESN